MIVPGLAQVVVDEYAAALAQFETDGARALEVALPESGDPRGCIHVDGLPDEETDDPRGLLDD